MSLEQVLQFRVAIPGVELPRPVVRRIRREIARQHATSGRSNAHPGRWRHSQPSAKTEPIAHIELARATAGIRVDGRVVVEIPGLGRCRQIDGHLPEHTAIATL